MAPTDLSNSRITGLAWVKPRKQTAGWLLGWSVLECWWRDGQDLDIDDTDFQGSILSWGRSVPVGGTDILVLTDNLHSAVTPPASLCM